MRIAVLGYGKQGQAAVEYWGKGNEITVCDFNENIDLPLGVDRQLGKNYLHGLDRFNLIVRSPIIHPQDISDANSGDYILRKVTTVTEEFMRNCPAQIIGVTGTKGKGTTSTLITKFLEAAGKTVHLGGNIGTPPLEMFKWDIKEADWVVLELANFQLIDLRVSPRIAVCLMVVPEHLDWHKDLAEYVKAKQNLFRHQSDKDLAIFNRLSDMSAEVAEVSPAMKMSYEVPEENMEPNEKNGCYVLGDSIYMDDEKVCAIADVKLLGRHNLQNVCAAIAAVWDIIGNDNEVIIKVVREYEGLEHRLELVREFNGVKYYDDSFGTTPETAIVAIEAVKEPKILILGGSDKKASYDELADTVKKSNVKNVMLIGYTGPAIRSALNSIGYTNIIDGGKDMKSIVENAKSVAQPGDAVLLSTACASFDMFKNYQDRGEQFHKAVESIT